MIRRAGEFFSALFDENQMREAENGSAFFASWKDIVEKNGMAAAAAHSRILNVSRGLVRIEVDHPGWKQALQTKESKFLHDFRYRFPDLDISGIALVLSKPEENIKEKKEKRCQEKCAAQSSVDEHNQRGKSPGKSRCKSNGERALARAAGGVAQNEEGGDAGYENIKDPALKAALRRLEREIIEREKNAAS